MLEYNNLENSEEPYVAIIDYGIGNLYSIQRACLNVGIKAVLTSDCKIIDKSHGIILPGVGAYGVAMENLKKTKVIDSIYNAVLTEKYIMGICLGMQLLMDESEEFGNHRGLGIIPGSCVKFDDIKMKTPQIMWNKLYSPTGENFIKSSPLKSTKNGEYMYFVHSYYVKPKDKSNILSLTEYNEFEYCSSIISNKVFGFQFHPEKSGIAGLDIYKEFKKIITND